MRTGAWTTPNDIRAQIQRRWDSGQFLAAVAETVASERGVTIAEDVPRQAFPIQIRIRKPGPRDLAKHFDDVRKWVRALEEASGAGYSIEWEETNNRVLGRNLLPRGIVVPTLEDALALIGRTDDAARFAQIVRRTLSAFPELADWLARRPLIALEHSEDWQLVLDILDWFRRHPRSGAYVRQIDVTGVDTKFIEQRKTLLSELFDCVLPDNAIDRSSTPTKQFEARYGLSAKPAHVRFRILDPALAINSLTDLTVRLDEFASLDIKAGRVFIVENEITGLAFPSVPDAILILCLGYAVDLLSKVRWLHDRDVRYWGDIDTHGFVMLDRLRGFLPNTCSFLMDRETLLAHRSQWTQEPTPHIGELTRLTSEEAKLYDDIRFDRIARAVRLEQEFVQFSSLNQWLSKNIKV